jgi:hypothetical protein
MRLSHTVSQPHSSGVRKPQSSGTIKHASVRRPCVVFKIKPPTSETDEDDETEEASRTEIAEATKTQPAKISETEIAEANETTATRPAIDLPQIDWVDRRDGVGGRARELLNSFRVPPSVQNRGSRA